MPINIDLKALGAKLTEVLLHQERYQMDLIIKDFNGDDFLFFYIYEARQGAAPRFYFIVSPYDQITKAAPQGAQVFEDGKLVLQLDYTEYVKVRTGLMDAFALSTLHHDPTNKKILYVGAGGVSEWSLRALKAYFPNVTAVDYKNASGGKASFELLGKSLGVATTYVNTPDIASYDYIFMHTNSRVPVLSPEQVAQIKKGAFVSIYSDKTEAATEIYKNAAVLLNWQNSFKKEEDLIEANKQGFVDESKVAIMGSLLKGQSMPIADRIVFRSGGTPMQNIAVLQLLLNSNKS